LKEGIKKEVVCYSISMSQLTKLLYDVNGAESRNRVDWIKNSVELLVIEEIEKDYKMEQSNTFVGSLVNDFFRVLYDNKKAIIITSNLPKKSLKESKIHADNIIDRFEELVDIILIGNSYRKQDENLKQILG
jgi:DNA replication protein DnaC